MWYCNSWEVRKVTVQPRLCFRHCSSWLTHQDSSDVFLLLACEDAHRMWFGSAGGWGLGRHRDAVDGVGLEVIENDLLTVDRQFLGFAVHLWMSFLPNNQVVMGSGLHLRPLQEGYCWYGLGDLECRCLEASCKEHTGYDQCNLAGFEIFYFVFLICSHNSLKL